MMSVGLSNQVPVIKNWEQDGLEYEYLFWCMSITKVPDQDDRIVVVLCGCDDLSSLGMMNQTNIKS